MAKYFEEDIPMDDIDERTPLIDSEQQEHETSFGDQENRTSFDQTQTKVQQLSDYLDEDIPFEHLRFRLLGKRLQFRKGGVWKDLTNYDGSFKKRSEISAVLTDIDFVSDRDIPRVYEAPKRSTLAENRRELTKQEVENLYKHMSYDSENIDLNLDRFKVENEKGFTILSFHKNGKWYALTKKTDGTFKTPLVIGKIFTKGDLRQLGVSPIQKLDEIVLTPKEVEHIELKDLNARITEIHDVIGDPQSLPTRELLGLDKALQRIQGEIVNGTSKLTELDDAIQRNKRKLGEAETEQQKQRIKERLERLKEEHAVRLESISQIKEKLSSQFARMRQTVDKIADKDRTLKERLKILWREQGLTLVSVLTAIGMTISTLVLALLPSSAGGPGGSGKSPHKVRNWVKKSLASLARLFGRLAKWALKALPSAIGSIISWIFSLLKTVATKAAEHVYAVIGFTAAAVSYLVFKK